MSDTPEDIVRAILTRNVVVVCPQVNVHCVQHRQQGESPRYTFNDGAMAVLGKLVNNGPEKEKMHNRPTIVLQLVWVIFETK